MTLCTTIPECSCPFNLKIPCMVTRFAAGNHPINIREIHATDIFQQRFATQEPHSGRRLSQDIYTGENRFT